MKDDKTLGVTAMTVAMMPENIKVEDLTFHFASLLRCYGVDGETGADIFRACSEAYPEFVKGHFDA